MATVLEEAHRTRNVDSRTAIDSKFRRMMSKAAYADKKKEYDAAPDREGKRALKLKWVDEEWMKIAKSRTPRA